MKATNVHEHASTAPFLLHPSGMDFPLTAAQAAKLSAMTKVTVPVLELRVGDVFAYDSGLPHVLEVEVTTNAHGGKGVIAQLSNGDVFASGGQFETTVFRPPTA